MRNVPDPASAVPAPSRNDAVQRKLDMDALRKRLSAARDKEADLRGACEGFEAVFLQKMWEQMRKTVPREGFLHSKDEETYQSLFDVELCKKMASAGGIGLADMLYEQLSRQLADSGRTTTPGRMRNPLTVPPSRGLLAESKNDAVSAPSPEISGSGALRVEDLYSPLPAGAANGNAEDEGEGLDAALQSLKDEVENASGSGLPGDAAPVTGVFAAGDRRIAAAVSAGGAPSPVSAAADPPRRGEYGPFAGMRSPDDAAATLRNDADTSFTEAAQNLLREANSARPAGPEPTPLEPAHAGTASGTAVLSWQGPGPVSAKPRPISNFARNRKLSRPGKKNAAQAPAARADRPGTRAEQAQFRIQAQTPAAPASNAAFPHNPDPDAARSPDRAHNRDAARTQDSGEAFAPSLTQAPADLLDGALKPLPGPVISRFGWEDDGAGRRRWKPGVEIAAAPGEPVRAVLPGTVVYTGPREGAGNTVVIEHSDGYRSYYGNLQPPTVRVGERVRLGAEFAKIAAQPPAQAGGENSASLHFELKKGEMALNPESVFNRAGEARRQDARAG
jgi:Rod binding domain-containing protein/murein DD-endopeptidase MepM/ murein hydrolase activator NlpD